ncbi:MAG: J domain-containing protein [Myxococcales bacterium]|nr:J domain-containing protein [Myxococcales bacterium]
MADHDYYAALGVARNADADAIKKAFRTAALKYHPDRNPGDKVAEERFKAVNRAHEVLSDPQKRQLYDQFGEAGLREGFDPERFRQQSAWGPGGNIPNVEDIFGGAGGGAVDFSQIFDQFFQGGRGGPMPGGARRPGGPGGPGVPPGHRGPMPGAQGRNLEAEISVDLATALRGGEITVNFNQQPLRVRIPAGVKPGARLRVPGKGVASPMGAPGDLMLVIQIKEHPFFWIEGEELHVRVPLTMLEAWRGARVRVPTPDGEVMVKTPPRANSGARLRVRGKGLPANGQRGATDLMVHLEVALPPDVPAIEAMMIQLENVYLGDPRAELKF